MRVKVRLRDKGILLALVIPIIGLLPIFGVGLANAADAPFHAHRVFALARLIEAGDLYPRWVPWFHLGYGYPVFTYYAPGATHIGAWLHLLGFDVVAAYNLTTAFAWCLGSLGMYLLARQFLPPPAALLACCLWVYAPSRFYEFWWQGSLAQIVSTSFIPLLFYGIVLTRRRPNPRSSLWIALPFAAIVMTHTPTTYIAGVFALPFALAVALYGGGWPVISRRLLFIGGGLALAAGLSAIFWLPVAAELSYVKISGELRDTVDFLKDGFLSLRELASLPQIIDSNDATLLMPRTLGLLGVILSGLGAVALLIRRRFGLALLLLLGLGSAIFLTLEPSLELWLTMPGFRNLRFAERILRLASLFVAALGASSLLLLPTRWRTLAALCLSALVIGQALPIMHPRDDDRVWTALSAKDEIEMEYAERNWGTTAYNEFRPIWGEATAFDLPPDLDSYVSAPLRIRAHEADFARTFYHASYQHLADNQILITVADRPTDLRLRQFYMPGWRLTVDGEAHPFAADDHFGLIQFRLPEGEHLLQLDYVGTPVQRLAALISLASIGFCLLIFWASRRSPRPHDAEHGLSTRGALLAGGALIAFAVFNSVWLQNHVFRIGGDDGKPAYMRRAARHTFDGAVTLLGYTLASDFISASEPLEIRLYWRREAGQIAEYQPLVQLVDLNATGAWAVSQPLRFEGGSLADLVPGQFMSDGHKLKLLRDVPAYVGKVSVQLTRRDGGGALAELPDGANRVVLPEVIQIHGPQRKFAGASRAIDFGSLLILHCLETSLSDGALEGSLHWEVLSPPPRDFFQFVHGYDEGGEIVAQNDGEPLDGLYPTSHWRAGQRLVSAFSLELAEDLAQAAFGLYDPLSGERVPVLLDGEAGDRVLLRPEDASC